jgi:SulP family sulfate permease
LYLDATGLETLDTLRKQLARRGGQLLIAGAHEQPLRMLQRSGFVERLGAAHLLPDVPTAAARARELAAGEPLPAAA